MALLDMFLSEEKRIARHTRRLTNRDSQPEDREASAQWLAAHGSPQSIMGLLARFEMSLDHQFKDKAEKDFVYGLLASIGDPVIEPLKVWMIECKSFANPLRILEDLADHQTAVDVALEVLAVEAAKDDFKPQKKTALLVWLAEQRDPRLLDLVPQCLGDFDEGVRYAASDVLAAQGSERARLPLLEALANPDEESNRLRVRLAEIFASRGWDTSEFPELAERLPSGFTVRGGRVIRG